MIGWLIAKAQSYKRAGFFLLTRYVRKQMNFLNIRLITLVLVLKIYMAIFVFFQSFLEFCTSYFHSTTTTTKKKKVANRSFLPFEMFIMIIVMNQNLFLSGICFGYEQVAWLQNEGEVAFFSANCWDCRNRADLIESATQFHDAHVVGSYRVSNPLHLTVLAACHFISFHFIQDNCGGGACGSGAGCPWVAGRLGANGGHVLIAVRPGLSRRLGAAGAGAAGSAPVLEFSDSFYFSLFYFIFNMYMNN